MSRQAVDGRDGARTSELLWLAGTVGSAVGLAVWKYRRKEQSYWQKSKAAASNVASAAAKTNPWLMIGTGTAALGGAAVAYRLRERERERGSVWQKAGRRADKFASDTGKQLRPWLGMIAAVAASAASAAESSKWRRKVGNRAEGLATTGLRLCQRLQTISSEGSKVYPRIRKLIAT